MKKKKSKKKLVIGVGILVVAVVAGVQYLWQYECSGFGNSAGENSISCPR